MTLTRTILRHLAALFALLSLAPLQAQTHPDWTTNRKPFHIAGNLYYVGSRDLAAYLITTPAGNILLNANLETSPPQIRASVEALGFRWADTRILLNSQGHFDHSAGYAAILRQTGAKLMVMDGDASVIESGGKDDFAHLSTFPPAHVNRILHDGDTVQLGGTVLTAHKTAGHTRGCTTWTMDVHDSGRTLHIVILGGLAALDSYRLVATPAHPASYPGIAADFEHGFALEQSLPCDIFLGAHGSYFGMEAKLARLPKEGPAVWIDPEGYHRAIAEARADFEQHLASDRTRPGR